VLTVVALFSFELRRRRFHREDEATNEKMKNPSLRGSTPPNREHDA